MWCHDFLLERACTRIFVILADAETQKVKVVFEVSTQSSYTKVMVKVNVDL